MLPLTQVEQLIAAKGHAKLLEIENAVVKAIPKMPKSNGKGKDGGKHSAKDIRRASVKG